MASFTTFGTALSTHVKTDNTLCSPFNFESHSPWFVSEEPDKMTISKELSVSPELATMTDIVRPDENTFNNFLQSQRLWSSLANADLEYPPLPSYFIDLKSLLFRTPGYFAHDIRRDNSNPPHYPSTALNEARSMI